MVVNGELSHEDGKTYLVEVRTRPPSQLQLATDGCASAVRFRSAPRAPTLELKLTTALHGHARARRFGG